MITSAIDTGISKPQNKQPFPYGYLLLGLLAGCIGVCFLILNNVYTYLAITMGVVMIIFSLVPFAQALSDKKRGVVFVIKIIGTICGIVAGIVTLIVQKDAIYVIANVLYLVMIIDSAYKVGAAIRSHKFYLMRFWVIAVLGSIILISAFLVSKVEVTSDENSTLIHAILTGILLIADGLMNILYAFFRKSFLIPEELMPENKNRADDSTPEGKTDDSVDEDTDNSSEQPVQTPPQPKKETVLTPPVILPFDIENKN